MEAAALLRAALTLKRWTALACAVWGGEESEEQS